MKEQPTETLKTITTNLDGSTEFSQLGTNDLVAVRSQEFGRTVLLSGGNALDEYYVPVDELGAGVHTKLNGDSLVKLDGEALVVPTESSDKQL